MNDKSCNNCIYAVFYDFGYSNYTVEGTEFICALKLHPDGQFDRFYGEDERLKFGANCSSHVFGDPIEMDVEAGNVEQLTPEQLAVWEML